MESGKRSMKFTYTPRSSKKMKYDSSVSFTRVYYSSGFDLFNFADAMFLKLITQRFPNCFLIVGIENDNDKYIMSLQEREEALKQCLSVRQILCPAPRVDYMFLKSFEIEYLCSTPGLCGNYAELDLGEGLVVLTPPVKLTNYDLIARVIASKNQFLNRCLSHGYSRKQLDISLFQQLSLKLISFAAITKTWGTFKFKLVKNLSKKGRQFIKNVARRFEYIENMIKESLVGNNDD